MSRVSRSASSARGVGVSHIKGYQQLGDLYSVEAVCDIDAARAKTVSPASLGMPAVVADFDALLGARSRHRRHLHALGAAFRAGAEGAPRRRARRRGEALRQLARRGRRARRGRGAVRQAPLADLPVPVFGNGIAQLRIICANAASSARPMPRRSRRIGGGCPPTTPIPGAGAGRRSSAAASPRTPSTTTTSSPPSSARLRASTRGRARG